MNLKQTQTALILTLCLAPALSSLAAAQTHLAVLDEADQEFLDLLQPDRAGQEVPAFEFLNGQGESVRLEDYLGTALVVNFWATWCAPCIAEMPALDRLNQAVEGVSAQVLAINTDFDASAAQLWLQENQIQTLEAFYDQTGNAFFDAGGTGLPYSLIIDADGRIAFEVFGDAHWDTPAAISLLQDLADRP